MSEPLFVLGCPRSGTTFLSRLIQYTPFGKPVESHFITKYYHKFSNVHKEVEKEFLLNILKNILSERAVMQWKLGVDAEYVLEQLPGKTYKAVVDYLLGLRFSRLGHELWSDKTPHYILDFEAIYDLYPKARYIFIVRDGRDVALSLLKQAWGPNNIYYCARLWADCNRWSQRLENLREKGQLFFVSYENLLDNTEKISKELYNFLDVEYPRQSVDAIIQKVMSGNYNKWKVGMTDRQVMVFEGVASETLNRFGYELSGPARPLSPATKIAYQFHQSLMHAKFLFVHNVIDGFKIKFLGKEPFGG